jgi:UDP-N-acetylmuramate dehydrogenase
MIEQNFSLKNYNTFGIDVETESFVAIQSEQQLVELLETKKGSPYRVLGGGSNILLTQNYKGLTIVMKNLGIELVEETSNSVVIKVQAGENWHDLVLWALENDYGGIENLALIPGSVGAAPIQNIGAYGVELESVFHSCRVLDIEDLSFKTFDKKACSFGYRNSIFKNELKGIVIITSVNLKLQKKPHHIQSHYGTLQSALDGKSKTIQTVAEAVIGIRRSKLPDPNKIGNSGSFFKNPIIRIHHFDKLLKKYPELPYYPDREGYVKIPAAWMIDKLGFKGKRQGDAGVHKKQALVLVNYGNAKGSELLNLAKEIQELVFKEFEIRLEIEVNLL